MEEINFVEEHEKFHVMLKIIKIEKHIMVFDFEEE